MSEQSTPMKVLEGIGSALDVFSSSGDIHDIRNRQKLAQLEANLSQQLQAGGSVDARQDQEMALLRARSNQLSEMVLTLTATVDLLGQVIVANGLITEEDFYSRLVDMAIERRAQHKALVQSEWDSEKAECVIKCCFCASPVVRDEAHESPTGLVCPACHERNT